MITKNPYFKKKELFLEVLVEGKYSLYLYADMRLTRFFFNKDNSNIEQLIFKRYKVSGYQINKNNSFKQQLRNALKCPNFKKSEIQNLVYKKTELVNFFVNFNKYNEEEYVNFEEKQKRDLFNLTVRPRLNNFSLKSQNYFSNYKDIDTGNIIGFGFGLEAEFILPFNKNKWAIVMESTYQNFKSESTTKGTNLLRGKLIANVDYSSVEIPLSLRHYLFLNDISKFFINVSYIFNLSSKSSIEYTRNDGSNLTPLEIKTRNNRAVGVGYKQNNRFSFEIRYQTNREILGNYFYWNSYYKTLSIIFGYSIF